MAETIRLSGEFRDGITPKLKKLNKQLEQVTKSFTRLSKAAVKSQKSMLKPMGRVTTSMGKQTKSIRTASKSWDTYSKAVARANRAARKFKPPRVPVAPRGPRVPRGGGAPVRGGGGMGFGMLTTAGFAAGAALQAVNMAANSLAGTLQSIVANTDDYQMGAIGLQGTLQALGGLEWEAAGRVSEQLMTGLEEIAAGLPGKTSQYLQIMSQTFDEQARMFGGVNNVVKDITAQGERSFTALLGLASVEARQDPGRVGADLQQLLAGDDLNRIGILKYNATLKGFYQANIDKGMEVGEALKDALEQTYSPARIAALKGTLSAQIESFMTRLTSAKGLLGGLREIKVDGATTTFARELGEFFNAMEELAAELLKVGIDPMVGFTKAIKFFTEGVKQLTEAVGTGDFGEISYAIGNFAGELAAKLINVLASIKFTDVVEAFNGFIVGLFSNIDYSQIVVGLMDAIVAMFRSIGGALLGGAGLNQLVKFNNALGAPIKALGSLNGVLKGIAKRLPGINAIVGIFDFFGRKAAGQDTATAFGGAAGGVLGGMAGAALGSFLGPVGTILGGVIGSWLGSWIGERLPGLFKGLGGAIGNAWNGFVGFLGDAWNTVVGWFKSAGELIGKAWDAYVTLLVSRWNTVVGWFTSAGELIAKAWDAYISFYTETIPNLLRTALDTAISIITGLFQRVWTYWTVTLPNAVMSAVNAVINAWQSFINWLTSLPGVVGQKVGEFITFVADLPGKVRDELFRIGDAILDWARDLPGRIKDGLGGIVQRGLNLVRGGNAADGDNSRTMPLGQAIARENAMKPAGSHLVIANSSETIIPRGGAIPAATGYDPTNNVRRFQRKLLKSLETLNGRLDRVSKGVPVVRPMGSVGVSPAGGADVSPANLGSVRPGMTYTEAATVGTLYMVPKRSGSGDVNVGGVNVTVNATPGMNEDQLAEAVAKRVVEAVHDVTHDELFE